MIFYIILTIFIVIFFLLKLKGKKIFHLVTKNNKFYKKFIYITTYGASAIAGFGKFLIYAKLLPPKELGIFTFTVLITSFCSYFSTFGILDGSCNIIPIMIGKGQKTLNTRSNGFFGSVFT